MTDVLLGGLWMMVGLLGWWAITRRTGDILHPLGLMTLFWFGVFGFAHWDVSAVYDRPYYALPLGLTTYAVALGAYLVFAFGFWMADPGLRPIDQDKVDRK